MEVDMPDDDDGLFDVVATVRDKADDTYELAKLCIAEATQEQNDGRRIAGWEDTVRDYDAAWGKHPARAKRSGHKNKSGRFSLLREVVRFNDGSAMSLGDMTLELVRKMKVEYGGRERSNAAGRKMAEALDREMVAAKAEKVSDLGEEKVRDLQVKAKYRV